MDIVKLNNKYFTPYEARGLDVIEKKRVDIGTAKSVLVHALLITVATTFLIMMLNGCSGEQPAARDPYPEMPADLRQMQGQWVVDDTNVCALCQVKIQDYTIRIRYQEKQDGAILKQNVSIDRLDEQRHLLIINGGTGAWPYNRSNDVLKLEFFNEKGWHKFSLKRSDA